MRRTLGADIDLTINIPQDLWCVWADKGQLENALLNLVLNARDAMNGVGQISVSAKNSIVDAKDSDQGEAQLGEYVEIMVSDNGPGIAKEIIDSVFDPFFSTKPLGEGTGLGLSMVYGFVKQSQGHVVIDSEPNKGATVRVFLPRSRSQQEKVAPSKKPDTESTGSGRILLVEDEPAVRVSLAKALRAKGFHVADVADGDAALAELKQGVYDVVLTDLVLGRSSNGIEVAAAARRVQPGIGLLFMSGYAEHTLLESPLLKFGENLILKPFTRSELLELLKTVLAD